MRLTPVMKAIVHCTVISEIELPEGTLTADAKRIINGMKPEDIIAGAKMDTTRYVDVRLPHASTMFEYEYEDEEPYRPDITPEPQNKTIGSSPEWLKNH